MSSSRQKNFKVYKETWKVWSIHRKKKLTETNPEEAQTLELLVKDDDKSIVPNMLHEIKQTMDKELKEIRKQRINKIRTSIKRNYEQEPNSGVEKYNNYNKKIHYRGWTGKKKRISKLDNKAIEIIQSKEQ